MKALTIRTGLIATTMLLLGARYGAAAQQQDHGTAAAVSVAASGIAKRLNAELLPAAAAPNDYRIGINDVLDVHVWKEPDLSRVVPVRPDGKISLPLIGDLEAKDKTTRELQGAIADRFKSYVVQPEVTVIVQQVNSQRYFVMGEVAHPGSYSLNLPTTVIQALAAAGGFREWAHPNKILILRRTESNRTEHIRFDYKNWVKKRRPADPAELKNGDVIVVP